MSKNIKISFINNGVETDWTELRVSKTLTLKKLLKELEGFLKEVIYDTTD